MARRKHVLGKTLIPLSGKVKLVVEETEVYAKVLGLDALPCQ